MGLTSRIEAKQIELRLARYEEKVIQCLEVILAKVKLRKIQIYHCHASSNGSSTKYKPIKTKKPYLETN